jgi:hypothetical protein
MSINLHNYELFILDYYEEKLDAAATRELMLYLDQHPEAREAFENYEAIMLTPDHSRQFEPKSSLKKTAITAVGIMNETNYEDYCIESIENNLSTTEQANLAEFINLNPQLQKTLDTYKKTVLQPDLSIVFDRKEMLKKTLAVPLRPAPLRRLVTISISVAAALAVVLITGIMLRSVNTLEKNASFALSDNGITGAWRKHFEGLKQGHVSVVQQPDNKVPDQASLPHLTFADVSAADNKLAPEKLQIIKGGYIELSSGKEPAVSAVLTKRKEYTDLIGQRELLLSRRTKDKTSSQEEGLADYVVKGIKNAARSSTKNKEDIKDNKRLGFWDIAGFGVYTYNKITDNNLTLDKETNAAGRLISLNIEDRNSPTEEKK